MSAVDGRLTSLVARVLEIPAAEAAAATAENTACWDSLAHLRLLMAIEEEFGVSFSPDEVDELDSVARLGDALERLLRAQAS